MLKKQNNKLSIQKENIYSILNELNYKISVRQQYAIERIDYTNLENGTFDDRMIVGITINDAYIDSDQKFKLVKLRDERDVSIIPEVIRIEGLLASEYTRRFGDEFGKILIDYALLAARYLLRDSIGNSGSLESVDPPKLYTPKGLIENYKGVTNLLNSELKSKFLKSPQLFIRSVNMIIELYTKMKQSNIDNKWNAWLLSLAYEKSLSACLGSFQWKLLA